MFEKLTRISCAVVNVTTLCGWRKTALTCVLQPESYPSICLHHQVVPWRPSKESHSDTHEQLARTREVFLPPRCFLLPSFISVREFPTLWNSLSETRCCMVVAAGAGCCVAVAVGAGAAVVSRFGAVFFSIFLFIFVVTQATMIMDADACATSL